MCTSFISRNKDIIIGMNFDNNGMKYSINTKIPSQFIVYVDTGYGKFPSFGVDSKGLFLNNLIVDSNGKGTYKRSSKNVTHTTKLITDLFNGVILTENLEDYLRSIEVVDTPNMSCHNMICDSEGNVWVVEPGRGNLYSPVKSTPYFTMTNFSLWDTEYNNASYDCNRYKIATEVLSKTSEADVNTAFQILELAKQNSDEWKTALSMVYSKKANAVYYCIDGNFNKRFEYKFTVE